MAFSIPTEPVQDSQGWRGWFRTVTDICNAARQSGTTAQRPTKGLWVGRPYFDTDLAIPIMYDGTGWIDYAGNTV